MLHKYLYTVFACLFCSIQIQAQYTIQGKITDGTSTGITYSTVRLLQTDSTFVKGTSTDSLGNYMIKNVTKGTFLVAVSSIGYDSKFISVQVEDQNMQIPAIQLATQSVALQEVEIKGQSFIRKKDHVLIIPDKQEVKHASTAYDLLYNLMIPTVDVNRHTGEVKTFGGNVTLCIDGQKSDYRSVQSLRARDIEKVEYYDAPTGVFANEIAVINYITKKHKTGGYVSVDGKQTIGYLNGDYNVVSKITNGNTNYMVFGGYQMKKKKEYTNKHEEFYFPDYTIARDKEPYDVVQKNNRQYVRLDIINQTDKRTLSGKLSFVHNSTPENILREQITYSNHYHLTNESSSWNNQKGIMPNLELFGKFKIKENQSIEAYLNSSYTHNKYNRHYSEHAETNFSSQTNVEEKFYSTDGRVNYNINLKHQNSLNFMLYHASRISSSDYTGDYDGQQHLWSGESILFGDYNQRIKQKTTLYFRLGVSSLQYRLRGDKLKSYFSPRLNTRFSYQPTPTQFLQISCAIANSYPEINSVNNIEQVIDVLQIKRGNPDLTNPKIYMPQAVYSLQSGRFNIQTVGNYMYITNGIMPNYYIEGDKLINSFQNEGSFHSLMTLLAISWKANDRLRLKVQSTFTRSVATRPKFTTLNAWKGELQMNYYLKDFSFNLSAASPQQLMDIAGLKIKVPIVTYSASVGWNRNNWTAEAGVSNPFTKNPGTIDYIRNTPYYSYTERAHQLDILRTGYLKMAYTFDFGRKTERTQDKVNTTINSAILKAE